MPADKVELRGLVPADLASALDAIALTYNLDRNALVTKILLREVNLIAHRSNSLQRMATGNPLLTDASAPTTNWGELT